MLCTDGCGKHPLVLGYAISYIDQCYDMDTIVYEWSDKGFCKRLCFFFGKNTTMDGELLNRTRAAYKLVLVAMPVSGMVMTLIAVGGVIGTLTDTALLGPNLAVAILTLLYSLILEALLIPVAGKLWAVKM